MQEKRIEWIDFCRGIAIILVILGHCVGRMGGSKVETLVNVLICSFHMPLFFFLSGLNAKTEVNNKEYIVKRIKKLFLPLTLFSFVMLTYKIVKAYGSTSIDTFLDSNLNGKGLYYLIGLTRKSIVSEYWFIPAIFAAEVLFQLIIRICKKKYVIFSVAVMMMILSIKAKKSIDLVLPLSSEIAMLCFPFYVVGHYNKDCLLNNKMKYMRLICILCLFFIGNSVTIVAELGTVNIYGLQVRNIFLFVINAGSGICCAIYISKLINKIGFVNYLGRNTLLVYCLHYFFLEFFVTLHTKLNIGHRLKGLSLIYAVTIVGICYCICRMVDYIKSTCRRN